jgi:hypothetical protein
LRLRPHSPLAPDLESASPGIVGHCNGQRIGMFLLGDDRQHSSLVADVPASALKFGEANLVTFRVGRFRSLGSRSDGTRLPIVAGLDEAPTLSAQGVSEHAAATGSAAGRNRMDSIACAGDWQFRIGDDPAFASLPLPAKFAAATDAYFEPLPE